MAPTHYNGFVFQNSDSDYLAVIEVRRGKYWGIQAVSHNGSHPYYSDAGIIDFPDNIGIAASFAIGKHDFSELLKTNEDVKRALRDSRQISYQRRSRMENLESQIEKERIARTFGDIGMLKFSDATPVFYKQCDRLFSQHLINL
jgi:hypothetical protein